MACAILLRPGGLMRLESLDQITQDYRHIYLQPHFDDAALSCGAAIKQQVATGQRTLVITVFGGVPPQDMGISEFALATHAKMSLPASAASAVSVRRDEDEAAMGFLGADTLWLDYLDAIYRGSPAMYQSNDAIFGTVAQGDTQLDEELGALVASIAERA